MFDIFYCLNHDLAVLSVWYIGMVLRSFTDIGPLKYLTIVCVYGQIFESVVTLPCIDIWRLQNETIPHSLIYCIVNIISYLPKP